MAGSGFVISPSEAKARLEAVGERMEKALSRAGRQPGSVRLVAVSKTFGAQAVQAFFDQGQKVFGESYIQEAREKIPSVAGSPEWHFVGHLQANKARHAVRLFSLIHALDSLGLAKELNHRLTLEGKTLGCLIQVNVSGEDTKSGIEPEALPALLDQISALSSVIPRGLMTMPPFDPDPDASRPHFRKLYELREKACPSLPELSMGMSGDYEAAIEEGATLIRVGTLLFGRRSRL